MVTRVGGSGAGATGINTSVPNVARIYDYILGGKDNFAADRRAAQQLLAALPDIAGVVRDNRSFIGRVVRFLAGEAGVRQFLDLGAGLPTQDCVHQMAHAIAPDARVVYVDNDPVVCSHGQALLGPGSYLAITHGITAPAPEDDPDGVVQSVTNVYQNASAQIHVRSTKEIERFFDGFEIIDPGVLWTADWRPDPGTRPAGRRDSLHGGVGRKPGP